MKRKLIALALCLLLAVGLALPAAAANYLDEISRYDLTVTLQADGSALLEYDIDWTVLDDTSYGALEWVKIGVPNQNISELTALSSPIKTMKPYRENGQDYVRLDLDRSYREGETVNMHFSLVATHLYDIAGSGAVKYEFTPGWFDEAETALFSLTWNSGSATGQYKLDSQGGTLEQTDTGAVVEWNNIPAGGKLELFAYYTDQSGFDGPLSEEMSRSALKNSGGNSGSSGSSAFAAIMIIILVVIVIIIIASASGGGGPGHWHGGFGAPYYYGRGPRPPHHGGPGAPGGSGGPGAPPSAGGGSSRGAGSGRRGGSGGLGGGCACACVSCACACACAGGGRAGCSAKQLKGYDSSQLLAALKQDPKGE